MAYEVNAAGYNEEDALPVSVDATGIPQLRSLMLELPAKERLDALKTYCWGHLPSLISSMESWSVQATIARRLELREVVAKPRKSAEGVIATLCREIMSHLEKTIVATIQGRRKPHWIGEGVKQIRIIEQHTKSTTFRTWCKYDGNHATKACPHWNWNAEFLKPVMEDMGQAWQDFDEACVQTYKHCLAELLGLLNGIRGELSAMGDVVVIPSEPFMKSLAPKKRQLQAAFEVFSTKLQRFSSLIRLNVITDDTEESYLLKALVPVYRSCVEESGKGSSPRRVAKLRTAMMRGEPFAVIEPGVKASMKSELETRHEKLVKKVHTVFDVVLADFDSTFIVEERPDEARNVLRGEIRDFVKKAEVTMNVMMEGELARATTECSG
ncbi:MAG: hypothetical protein LQ352_003952 [Teloschistes flavicans]|nr:MAG: hypothetical protein LQ352_003952 [Teloschistes flavicans]